MKNLIRKILKEAREPVHGDSIPDKWIDGNTREFFESDGIKYRAIFPWNRASNGRIRMQIIPYDNKDKQFVMSIIDEHPNFLSYEFAGKPAGTTEKYLTQKNHYTFILRKNNNPIGFIIIFHKYFTSRYENTISHLRLSNSSKIFLS